MINGQEPTTVPPGTIRVFFDTYELARLKAG
jgi:hypothetical protein